MENKKPESDTENGKIQSMKSQIYPKENKSPNSHISEHEFLLDWFGNFGRVLGNPPKESCKRYFSNDPLTIFDCMELAEKEELPAYITVQPFVKYGIVLGIEKLFYDFDYGKKSDNYTPKQIEKHSAKCKIETLHFIHYLKNCGIEPLVFFSGGKGYHIYIFFDKIYTFEPEQYDFWKMVYKRVMERFIDRDYKYMDSTTIGDLQQFARIPLSIHQKTKKRVVPVNQRLEQDKLRSLEFYRSYGLKSSVIKEEAEHVINIVKESVKRTEETRSTKKTTWEIEHGFTGEIRPCFSKRIEQGEMCHGQRLALLIEAFFSGKQTEDELVNTFRKFHDFNESKTRYQIKWYLNHQNGVKPYRCSSIKEKGWCLGEDCPIWRARERKKQ